MSQVHQNILSYYNQQEKAFFRKYNGGYWIKEVERENGRKSCFLLNILINITHYNLLILLLNFRILSGMIPERERE